MDRTTIFMIIAVIVAVIVLLTVNVTTMVKSPRVELKLDTGGIQHVEVSKEDQKVNLNIDQQKIIIPILKQALPVENKEEIKDKTPANFEKLVIYRENAPEIVITPVGYVGPDLIFTTPEWNKNELLREMSHGVLKAQIIYALKNEPEENKKINNVKKSNRLKPNPD